MPAREGVLKLMDEAREHGLLVGVCSAATKSSAICVLESLLGPQRFQVGSSAEKGKKKTALLGGSVVIGLLLPLVLGCSRRA